MNTENDEKREAVRKIIEDELASAGISPVRLGYSYMMSAITEIIFDDRLMVGITKKLYPYIAECYCTSSHAVERNIRSAIESACREGSDSLKKLVNYNLTNKISITNKEFIFKTVNRVKRRLEISNYDEY